MSEECASQGAENNMPASGNSLLQSRGPEEPWDAKDTRRKFLALCLDGDEPDVVKVVTIDLTGLMSDREVFSKIQDTYLNERGNRFFNWAYKRLGCPAGLGWMRFLRFLPPLALKIIQVRSNEISACLMLTGSSFRCTLAWRTDGRLSRPIR